MPEGVTGIIVAGGLSRRFGSDKASASLRGRPLLQWVRDALAPVVDEMVVVTAAGQTLPPMHPAMPVTVVEDREPERGPLAGLAAGFAVAASPVCFAASCDAPLLRATVVERVTGALGNHDAVLPEVGGFQQPLAAAYRREPCLAAAEASLAAGGNKVIEAFAELDVLALAEDRLARVDPDLRSFRNANTPDELAAIATLLDAPAPSAPTQPRRKRSRPRGKSRRRH
ncbi:MAG: molybdenum cofactor guanylyltransferase [Dehalococcoidia bacterium]|nr:molybdenum cofactor guanylyltransferase [Dehalococcoidia bacterium]